MGCCVVTTFYQNPRCRASTYFFRTSDLNSRPVTLVVYPDPVYFHPPGQAVVVDALASAPVSAAGDIQDQVKKFVERPGPPTALIVRIAEGGFAVDIAPDEFRCQLHTVHMEFFGGVGYQPGAGFVRAGLVVKGGGMHREMHVALIVADVFHDIDLPGIRPADSIAPRVFRQHPDSRPAADAPGQFGAYLDPAVEHRPALEGCSLALV